MSQMRDPEADKVALQKEHEKVDLILFVLCTALCEPVNLNKRMIIIYSLSRITQNLGLARKKGSWREMVSFRKNLIFGT